METETPVVAPEKKARKSPFLTILIVILALAAIGLGVWGKMTNDKITATLEAKAALDGKFDSLLAENGNTLTDFETATADLKTTKTDLEKAQKDLKSTQDSLTRVQENVVKIQSDLDKAMKYAAVLSGFLVERESDAENIRRIKATEDSTLQDKYDTAYRSGTSEAADAFFEYIIKTISSLLK